VPFFPVDAKRRQRSWHRRLKHQSCIYCGQPGGHPDHVPPAGTFYGEPDDLITVPCCADCTNEASELDHEFRVAVSLPVSVSGHTAREAWMKSSAAGAVRAPKLRTPLSQTLRRTSDGGGVLLPTNALSAVGIRIVRGLFWHEYGDRLSPTTPISVGRIGSVTEIPENLGGAFTKREVADGQFRYGFFRLKDEPDCSCWVLEFHGKITLLAQSNRSHDRSALLGSTVLSSP